MIDIKQTRKFLNRMEQLKYYYFNVKSEPWFSRINFGFREKAFILYQSSDGSYFIKIILNDTYADDPKVFFETLEDACLYIQNDALQDFVRQEDGKIRSWSWKLNDGCIDNQPINYKLHHSFSRFTLWRFLKRIGRADLYSFYQKRRGKLCVIRNSDKTWQISNENILTFKTRDEAYLYIYKKELQLFIHNEKTRIELASEFLKPQQTNTPTTNDDKEKSKPTNIQQIRYRKKNRGDQYENKTRHFLGKIDQVGFFFLNEKIIERNGVTGFVYDIKKDLYRTVYYDRGDYLWGKYFISYRDVTLFICRQAFTVFTAKQKLLIAQWQKELRDRKSWVDLHFGENRKEKPEGYRPLSKNYLIRFLRDIKYRISKYALIPTNQESNFFFSMLFNNRVALISQKRTRLISFSSFERTSFNKEYGKQIQNLSRQYGSKKGAWLHIYESEFNTFADRYENYFREEDKRFTNDYFEKHIWDVELQKVLWNPNELNEVIKVDRCCDSSDLKPTWIERYGNLYGSHVSNYGTPFQLLSLPPALQSAEYHVLQIMAAIETTPYTVAPAFGQPGGATIYVLPEPISELMRKGVLKLIR